MPRSIVYEKLSTGAYQFLDGGAGQGGSLHFVSTLFNRAPGLGLELMDDDARIARAKGYDVVTCNVMDEEFPDRSVSFCSAMDFLEHLPDEPAALDVMKKMARAARDFIFIRHPSFEDIDYLAQLGLKITWTDWWGHPNMMKIEDYRRFFADVGWTDYVINPRSVMFDSWHPSVVPIDAPTDTLAYDADLHGPKPYVRFDRPVWEQFDIFIRLRADFDPELYRKTVAVPAQSGIRLPGASVGVYQPSDAMWTMRDPDTETSEHARFSFGASNQGWFPLVGDWDGDGVASPGAYDPATGSFFMRNALSDGEADISFMFGPTGGIPVVGDWDGDGVDTIGIYSPEDGFWALRNENALGPSDLEFVFCPAGGNLIPVAGDWDGRGCDSIGFYDPETARWYLASRPTNRPIVCEFEFGPLGALPVVGDWDDDGIDTVGAYHPQEGRFSLGVENARGTAAEMFTFGPPGGVPVAGKWRKRGEGVGS